MVFHCSPLRKFSALWSTWTTIAIYKSNLHYTRGITLKRVASGGAYLRSLASGQHNSEETSQRWRTVGDTVSDLTEPGFESQTSRTDCIAVTTDLTGRYFF